MKYTVNAIVTDKSIVDYEVDASNLDEAIKEFYSKYQNYTIYMIYPKYEKVKEIIRENNEINVQWSKDDFFIFDDWESLNKFVSIVNNIHESNVIYGRVEIDNGVEYVDIDNIINDWGFSDTYSICSCCYGEIDTQPYDMVDYWIHDGEMICGNCIREEDNSYAEDYISKLLNNEKLANTILKDTYLEKVGFKQCNCNGEVCEFENGWSGSNDNPTEILKNAISKHPDRDFMFDILAVGQFDIRFTIWSRDKEKE